MKFSIVFFISVFYSSFIIADIKIDVSPGDSYVAYTPLQLQDNYLLTSPNAGLCFGVDHNSKLNNSDNKCPLSLSTTFQGIKLSVHDVKAVLKNNYKNGTSSMEISGGVVNKCITDLPINSLQSLTCDDNYIFHSYFNGRGYYDYSIDATLSTILINVSSNTPPGVYWAYVSISGIDRLNWKVKKEERLRINVRSNTCTLSNQTVNMGNIDPGKTSTKTLNLDLLCTYMGNANTLPYGASLKYKNKSYSGNKTNLSNVSISLKNKAGEIISPLQKFRDYQGLQIEVKAENNAEPGSLKIPLLFTLTYS